MLLEENESYIITSTLLPLKLYYAYRVFIEIYIIGITIQYDEFQITISNTIF